MNNKVLFIAYHFPPDAAVGALRSQKFVKYLPEYGWQPFVLTVHHKYYSINEFKRLDDVKDVIVERTECWRTPLQIFIDFRDKYRLKNSSNKEAESFSDSKSLYNKKIELSFLKKLVAGLNWFPDDKLYWLFPGFIKGILLIRRNKINLIVVSVPPHSAIIFAFLLSVMTGAKLVIDFRDPWCLSDVPDYNPFKPKFLFKLESIIQKKILKKTESVIVTNENFKKAMLRDNQFLDTCQVNVIHNGCDFSDFISINNNDIKFQNKFIISYLGTFYFGRNPEIFLKSISQFVKIKNLNENDIEIKFIGNVEQYEGISVRMMIKKAGLEKIVKIIGRVEYLEALRLMKESTLLLLLAPSQPYQIPAKIYEYIAAGRPILALTGLGATSSLVEDVHCGISVDHKDVTGIILALERLYEDFLIGGQSFVCDSSYFERRNQAGQLANILNQVHM